MMTAPPGYGRGVFRLRTPTPLPKPGAIPTEPSPSKRFNLLDAFPKYEQPSPSREKPVNPYYTECDYDYSQDEPVNNMARNIYTGSSLRNTDDNNNSPDFVDRNPPLAVRGYLERNSLGDGSFKKSSPSVGSFDGQGEPDYWSSVAAASGATSDTSFNDTTEKFEDEDCLFCNRPIGKVVCMSCGHFFTGRATRHCASHPNTTLLMDISKCPKCLCAKLQEIGGGTPTKGTPAKENAKC